MVKFSVILLSALFLLVGCWRVVKQEAGKTELTKSSSPLQFPKAKSEQKFLLKGASFSISRKGLIYFVDLSDPSIVMKADLKSPDLTSHFIDLKSGMLPWLHSQQCASHPPLSLQGFTDAGDFSMPSVRLHSHHVLLVPALLHVAASQHSGRCVEEGTSVESRCETRHRSP